MTSLFAQLALIGPTASGKSALALEIARRYNGVILSLDSLAVYRYTDIVSAKPTLQERGDIPHYGIDILDPDEHFDVTLFAEVYRNVYAKAKQQQRLLIIVGGTSFYLKALMEGMSPKPDISPEIKQTVRRQCRDLADAYAKLEKIDPLYAGRITPADRYRIEKAWEIYLATHMPPTAYFQAHPPTPVIKAPLPIYEIVRPRDELRQRIRLRTEMMLASGLIDEVAALERRYTRAPHCMKAIGIRETLAYLDGRYDKATLLEKIAVNTGRLAKRQETFNRTQFHHVIRGEIDTLRQKLADASHIFSS